MKTTLFLVRIRDSVYPFTFPKAVQAAVAISMLLTATACGKSGVCATDYLRQNPIEGHPSTKKPVPVLLYRSA